MKKLFILSCLAVCLLACSPEEAIRPQGPFFLDKVEIRQASSNDGRALPYSSSVGPRIFLRFGPFQGTYPAYQSSRSRQVTELPVTWGFAEDSIMMEEQEWYIVLYEFNRDLGEDLLFSQKLSLLDYPSPVSLTDTEGKFRIDVYYEPLEP